MSQLIYMGAHDRNDATLYGDAFHDDQRELVHGLLGRPMPARWQACRDAYAELGAPAQLVTYEATGHTIRPEMIDDAVRFFRANEGEERTTIDPHEYAYEPFEELEAVHVDAVLWRGDERIPAFARDLLSGRGTFVIAVEEWLETQDHRQLDAFRERAGFRFELRAESRAPVEITSDDFVGTCSRGDGSFQGFVVRLSADALDAVATDVDYTLAAVGDSERAWRIREGVKLRRRAD